NDLASACEPAVSHDVAAAADDQSVSIFDRFRHGGERHAALGERRESIHNCGRNSGDNGFHHLIEKQNEATDLAVATLRAHGKSLQTLHAADGEAVVAQSAGFNLAVGRLFLLLLEQGCEFDL